MNAQTPPPPNPDAFLENEYKSAKGAYFGSGFVLLILCAFLGWWLSGIVAALVAPLLAWMASFHLTCGFEVNQRHIMLQLRNLQKMERR